MSAAAHKKGPTTTGAGALRWRALLDTRPSGPALLDTRGKCSGCAFDALSIRLYGLNAEILPNLLWTTQNSSF